MRTGSLTAGIVAGVIATTIAASLAGAADSASAPVAYQRAAPELVKPAPPEDAGKPACKAAVEYLRTLEEHRYSDMHSLYAENAVHYAPDGHTYRGAAAIGAYYEALHKWMNSTPVGKGKTIPVAFIADGPHCLVELAGGGGDVPVALSAIDHFTVNKEGKIERFIVFLSPPATIPPGILPTKIPAFDTRK